MDRRQALVATVGGVLGVGSIKAVDVKTPIDKFKNYKSKLKWMASVSTSYSTANLKGFCDKEKVLCLNCFISDDFNYDSLRSQYIWTMEFDDDKPSTTHRMYRNKKFILEMNDKEFFDVVFSFRSINSARKHIIDAFNLHFSSMDVFLKNYGLKIQEKDAPSFVIDAYDDIEYIFSEEGKKFKELLHEKAKQERKELDRRDEEMKAKCKLKKVL